MAVHSLDPTTGKLLWEQPFPLQSALAISSPILTGNRLFVTAFYNGPLMLEISGNPPKATVVWKGKSNKELPNQTDGLHSIMSTPVIADGHIFGVCSYGRFDVWMPRPASGFGRPIRPLAKNAGPTPFSLRTKVDTSCRMKREI